MDQRIRFGGYICRFRLRTVSIKRKVNGRTRGRYEGNYVYLELAWMEPHATVPGRLTRHKRELYLGKERVKGNAVDGELELVQVAGKRGGYVARVSDTDLYAPAFETDLRAIEARRSTHNGRSANRKKG